MQRRKQANFIAGGAVVRQLDSRVHEECDCVELPVTLPHLLQRYGKLTFFFAPLLPPKTDGESYCTAVSYGIVAFSGGYSQMRYGLTRLVAADGGKA